MRPTYRPAVRNSKNMPVRGYLPKNDDTGTGWRIPPRTADAGSEDEMCGRLVDVGPTPPAPTALGIGSTDAR